jgi:hypothetical protein
VTSGPIDSLDCLGAAEVVGLVRRLIGEVERLREENGKLNAALAGVVYAASQSRVEFPCFRLPTKGIEWSRLG